MNSVVRFMYWGTIPAGSAIGGLLADPLGLRRTLLFAGICATAACVPIAASPIRKLRTLPEPPPEQAIAVDPLIHASAEAEA